MESEELVQKIVGFIKNKKGFDIKILNLQNLSSIADYFIICSGNATLHVKAISDEIDKKFREQGIKCYHKEGYDSLNWVLLDYLDVVIHIFRGESREFYNLEKIWGDAEITEIENEEE